MHSKTGPSLEMRSVQLMAFKQQSHLPKVLIGELQPPTDEVSNCFAGQEELEPDLALLSAFLPQT